MSANKVVLTSIDGESFEIDEAVARKFQFVSHMMDDVCVDKPILLANVTGKILALAIEYCKKHVDDKETNGQVDEAAKKEMVTWDAEFVNNFDLNTMFSLINAANYLDAKELFDFTCRNLADRIKDKTPEEIRRIFNIENDFTPEEEAEVRLENDWVFF